MSSWPPDQQRYNSSPSVAEKSNALDTVTTATCIPEDSIPYDEISDTDSNASDISKEDHKSADTNDSIVSAGSPASVTNIPLQTDIHYNDSAMEIPTCNAESSPPILATPIDSTAFHTMISPRHNHIHNSFRPRFNYVWPEHRYCESRTTSQSL